jgi:hypothetical protein
MQQVAKDAKRGTSHMTVLHYKIGQQSTKINNCKQNKLDIYDVGGKNPQPNKHFEFQLDLVIPPELIKTHQQIHYKHGCYLPCNPE